MEGAHQGDHARRGCRGAPGSPPCALPGLRQQLVHVRRGGGGQIPGGVCSQSAAATPRRASQKSQSSGQAALQHRTRQQKVESVDCSVWTCTDLAVRSAQPMQLHIHSCIINAAIHVYAANALCTLQSCLHVCLTSTEHVHEGPVNDVSITRSA